MFIKAAKRNMATIATLVTITSKTVTFSPQMAENDSFLACSQLLISLMIVSNLETTEGRTCQTLILSCILHHLVSLPVNRTGTETEKRLHFPLLTR